MQGGIPPARDRLGGRQQERRPPDYYAQHDPSGSAKLSTTVVHALSDVMGVDVTDTGFTLYDCIDPDSLDRIFAVDGGGPPTTGHVAFTVDGYQVTVYSNGQIVITPPPQPK